MKKTYESPIAEKVQFAYREQLAASAEDTPENENDNGGNLTPEEIISRAAQLTNSESCSACEYIFGMLS